MHGTVANGSLQLRLLETMPSRTGREPPREGRSTSQAVKDADKGQSSHDKAAMKKEPREKTFMDRWTEPAIAEQPSYQDHNGSAYGVLEHMQPLGEAPNAKVKARVKAEAPRKSLARSSVATGLDAQETPEGTPAPQSAPAAEEHVLEPAAQQTVVIDDEKDADYAPGGKKKERSARGRPSKRQSDAGTAGRKTQSNIVPTTNKKRRYDPPKLQRVVEAAKERALDLDRPDLAAAVHEVWSESLHNTRLTDLLEAILTQEATKEQNIEFQGYVKQAKKRIKAAKQQERELPAASGASNGSIVSSSIVQPQPPQNFSSKTPMAHDSSAIPSTEKPEQSKTRISLKINNKSPYKEPTERRRSGHSNKLSASPQKKKNASYESDSSLTDLTEDDGAMDIDTDNELATGPSATSRAVNGTVAKDHAAERGSLAAPDRKVKRTSADAELEDDERERTIAAKKKRLSENVTRDYDFEESDIRQSNRATVPRPRTTRAQRPQNGSLVPPPMSLQPNGTHPGTARGSRAVSADLDSPLSELSAPSSRMSTPHVFKGPPKPPPGKRAKTKTS
jgi:hypothetical protein